MYMGKMRTMRETDPTYRLLIVEDNPADMQLFVEAARYSDLGERCSCECVSCGEDAIAHLCMNARDTRYDAVILDLMMLRLTGQEVLRAIRRTEALTDLPVLVMTNSDYSKDMIRCRELGANGYFQKTPDFDRLIDFFSSIAFASGERSPLSASTVERMYYHQA